jgi:hypothetical protein
LQAWPPPSVARPYHSTLGDRWPSVSIGICVVCATAASENVQSAASKTITFILSSQKKAQSEPYHHSAVGGRFIGASKMTAGEVRARRFAGVFFLQSQPFSRSRNSAVAQSVQFGRAYQQRETANEFNRCFDAPNAISAKKWRGHDANDYRGCCSDCGCNHHAAVAIFFDRAIDRCQAAVGRTPPNGGGSFALQVFWQFELLVSSLGRSSGRREVRAPVHARGPYFGGCKSP